jgi:hypothetical protein
MHSSHTSSLHFDILNSLHTVWEFRADINLISIVSLNTFPITTVASNLPTAPVITEFQ